MKKLIAHLEREVPNSLYLAFFRVFLCFHLLKKVILLAPSGSLLYGADSFVRHEDGSFLGIPLDVFRSHYDLLIPVYVFLIGLFLFGIGRNLTALILYVVFRLFQEMTGVVSNGGTTCWPSSCCTSSLPTATVILLSDRGSLPYREKWTIF